MRAPSLLAQCLLGLVPQDRASHCIANVSDRDMHLPSPAVEILPSKMAHPYKYAGENVELQGLNVFKGKVSVADIIGFTGSETISSKSDGSMKYWDSSIDLVNVLKHEIRDGQLSFRGKRVLELGCGYGLPGIFACLKGACTVHFQDLNAETIRCTTIPNVLANLEQARDRQSRQPESPLTPSRYPLSPSVHFYAGDWEELPTVLSIVRNDAFEVTTGMSQSLSEEDFMDGCSSQDGSIIETIRCTTIPNVLANLEQARDRQSRQPESPLTPSRYPLSPSVHFYAGDWEELPTVLSIVRNDAFEVTTGMSQSLSEEDFMDGCSSQDGSIIGQETSSRRSRKLSGSRAWERASETDHGEGGYDVILMTDIPYSVTSLKKLYALIKKCLRPPYGVLYLATKRNYIGFNNGARQLKNLVDEEGIFGAHLVKEMTERDVWKFFLR
ncbi:hypothetical protein P3X46_010459 [Hevea brasiliensis]|uniref:Methyltransferase small domain-containing protein n=1 Tax=Hevea brasiliensis TaxID=3981 RepID=A0ABQ9MI68_HEVBR|nr:hypothetical protein P3X46_010459 [Hevea brasiliensis]